jgi:hypothetical protein
VVGPPSRKLMRDGFLIERSKNGQRNEGYIYYNGSLYSSRNIVCDFCAYT